METNKNELEMEAKMATKTLTQTYVSLRNINEVGECFSDLLINAEEEMGSMDNATIGNIVDFVTTNANKTCNHGCVATLLPKDEEVTFDIRIIKRYNNEGSSSDITNLGTVTWTNQVVTGSDLNNE